MIMIDVLTELMTAAAATGATAPQQWGDRPPHPPMVLVELPEQVVYDSGGHFTRYPDVPLAVLVGPTASGDSFRKAAAYLDDTGPRSIKQAVESFDFTACATVRVATASVEAFTLQGHDFLGALFHIDVTG